MKITIDEKTCTGCRACEQMCPVHAINMYENNEGFIYPQINQDICVGCGLCIKKCPSNTDVRSEGKLQQPLAYAARLKNREMLLSSTSGGFFVALAEEILSSGGSVFGVTMDENYNVFHKSINTATELYMLQGSKYVASDTNESYIRTQEMLIKGKRVLYSGLPCQIAGLKSFLQRDYPNLVTVDVVCHGVPSHKLFRTYVDSLRSGHGNMIKDYRFRDKSKYGWGVHWSYSKNGRRKYGGLYDDPYISVFIDAKANRESCYCCKYIGVDTRPGDFTLADYWGVERVHPGFASRDGVSAIICHTEKAKMWCDKALQRCFHIETDVESIKKYNPSLVRSAKRPEDRDSAYSGIDSMTPEEFVRCRMKRSPQKVLKTKIKLLMPYGVRAFVKRCTKH